MEAVQDVVIRPYRPEDFQELVDVYDASYQESPEYGEPDRGHVLRYLRWLVHHHTLFLVAEAEGKPVGFIVVDANWRDPQGRRVGEVHELAVHPDYWGQGLAQRLLAAALDHFREQGLERAGLWVGEDNKRAQAFYQRAGFRRSGQQRGVWIRMEKSL